MTYIDLNMIRVGVVPHPGEWLISGYHEIQNPPVRYTVIDPLALLDIFGFTNSAQLRQACREWVEESLQSGRQIRNGNGSESLAIGRPEFVEQLKVELGIPGIHRESVETDEIHVLKEPPAAYKTTFNGEMACLRVHNGFQDR